MSVQEFHVRLATGPEGVLASVSDGAGGLVQAQRPTARAAAAAAIDLLFSDVESGPAAVAPCRARGRSELSLVRGGRAQRRPLAEAS